MDMMRALNKWIGIGVGVGLLAFGSAASAGPTSEWHDIGEFQQAVPHDGFATKRFESAAGLATNFGASAWDEGSSEAATSTLTLDAQTAAATESSTDERRRVLASASISDTSTTSVVAGSPASVQLTLWNFINNIRAQQTNNQFVQLQTAAANIDFTINNIAAVPLPRAFWLFAGGIAALAIARRFARRARAGDAARALVAA